ncbi:MAG: CHAT domain-containing protein [Mojavia pulchra JT2-VF2]|jgi:hypothetical protein|uniref:CHAT domain-containing protein n=1 Tax=Mojavia pulchra JT2-VF2 TaxID=287848 RepID=A0A951Q3F9_9NOST|nr:CHAT domain-containing protein [Mojavia pulchra JT2-VF2]
MSNSPAVKTILVLAASPVDEARLRLDVEVREIEEGLRRSKYRDQIKLQPRSAVRINDLRRALLDVEPQIVHFCGHGVDEGLIFEDEQGKSKLVNTEALANLFELFAGRVECIVLNACYSEAQAKAMIGHVGYVIGMSKAIGDKAAINFSVGFYDALGGGRTVEDAYKFGCNAIQLQGIPEHLTPVIKINTALKAAFGATQTTTFTPKPAKPAPKIDRFKLIKLLNDLPPQQLDMLLFTVDAPNGVVPPMTAPQGDRAAALLRWAQGPTGCGLETLQQELDNILSP